VRILTVTAVLCALVFSTGAMAAGEEGAEMKARTHFAAGEYKEALEIYARLYAETMHPTYLRNIARCHQNLGNPDKAISSFREYLRKSKNLSADQRAEIEGYIAEMEQLKKSKAAEQSTPAAERAAPPAAAERAPLPPAPPPSEPPPAVVGPPTVVATPRADGGDGGAFYTRAWFWIGVGALAAGAVTAAVLLSADHSPTHGNLGVFDTRSPQ